jgi:hypothetical protein
MEEQQMPMFQILTAALTVLLLALAVSMRVPRMRADMTRPLFWALQMGTALLLSLASLTQSETGHAGTGFITRYGWPKPFYFVTHPETGAIMEAWALVYFIGNACAYGALLLLGWTAWRVLPR